MKAKGAQIVTLVLVTATAVTLFAQRQAVRDWWLLRGYTAPAAVVRLATDASMSDQARHLWYVNHPLIATGKDFTGRCPKDTEKTIVLGCYLTNDHGIYIYDVTDARLNGVEQVTAAHEMLHAAYDRLSRGERSKVDAMLTDYYNNDLTDERIKDTINTYKVTEPGAVVSEMHSIFGTEITDLPTDLERYYAQYFVRRSVVTAFAAQYQGEFTSRKTQIATYQAQLADLKQQITTNRTELDRQQAALESQNAHMQGLRSSGQTGAYNAAVPAYNRAVDVYNTLAKATKSLVGQYNTIVDQLNAVVLEEQQLTKALSAE